MSPVMVRELMPCSGSAARSHASVSENCEKTNTFVGVVACDATSAARIATSFSTKALSLHLRARIRRDDARFR